MLGSMATCLTKVRHLPQPAPWLNITKSAANVVLVAACCTQTAASTAKHWMHTQLACCPFQDVFYTKPCTQRNAASASHWQQACLQEEIEKGFLRRAMTLCQDTDYIVRINMCDGLHRLAAAVGLEVTVSTILPEILELMKDEEALVRVSATNSLVAGTQITLDQPACMYHCLLRLMHLRCQRSRCDGALHAVHLERHSNGGPHLAL